MEGEENEWEGGRKGGGVEVKGRDCLVFI